MFDYGKYTDLIFISYGIVFGLLVVLTCVTLYYGFVLDKKLKQSEQDLEITASTETSSS